MKRIFTKTNVLKITGHIDINQNRDVVTSIFANPKYLKEYQDTFLRKEHLSGEEGKENAVSHMYYQFGKKEILLVETITKNELPDRFEAYYHHKHMDNTMVCEFEVVNKNTTRYHYSYEYMRINWVMPKLMAILFPNMYRKPAEKWLRQFKEFAENQ